MISLWLLKLMFNPCCLIPPIIKLSLLIKIDWLCFVFGSGPILLTYTESALINEYFSIFNIYPDSGVRSFCAPVLMVWRPKIFLVRRLHLDCNVFSFFSFLIHDWSLSLILTWPCDTIHLGCSPQSTKYFYSHAQEDLVICAEYQCWPTKLNFVHFC